MNFVRNYTFLKVILLRLPKLKFTYITSGKW